MDLPGLLSDKTGILINIYPSISTTSYKDLSKVIDVGIEQYGRTWGFALLSMVILEWKPRWWLQRESFSFHQLPVSLEIWELLGYDR